MTNQEKKRYLGRYRTLNREIDRLMAEKSEWRARAERITPSYTGMPASGAHDSRLTLAVEKIVELEGKINQEIDRLVTLREEIERSIAGLPDESLQLLLRYRYIQGYTWERIAVEMNYGYQWACKLHGRALELLKPLEVQRGDRKR